MMQLQATTQIAKEEITIMDISLDAIMEVWKYSFLCYQLPVFSAMFQPIKINK